MSYIIDAFNTGDGHFTIQPAEDGKQFQLEFVVSLVQHIQLGHYSTREAARDAIVARSTKYEAWDDLEDAVTEERIHAVRGWVRHQFAEYDPSVTQRCDIPLSEFEQPSPLAPKRDSRPSA